MQQSPHFQRSITMRNCFMTWFAGGAVSLPYLTLKIIILLAFSIFIVTFNNRGSGPINRNRMRLVIADDSNYSGFWTIQDMASLIKWKIKPKEPKTVSEGEKLYCPSVNLAQHVSSGEWGSRVEKGGTSSKPQRMKWPLSHVKGAKSLHAAAWLGGLGYGGRWTLHRPEVTCREHGRTPRDHDDQLAASESQEDGPVA